MTLADFFKTYPDEASCIESIKQKRLEHGVICRKCGNSSHRFRNCDLKFECRTCLSRQSIRSGTVMEHSNLPFWYWLFCIQMMTLTKKSFSALEMQRMIGHKRYEPIWYMMHKIRRVMSKRDDEYELSNYIEIDEGFFERVDDKEVKEAKLSELTTQKEQLKRGRGSQKQAKVLVMVESKEVESQDNPHRPNRKVGYLKMKVIEDLKGETITQKVKDNVNENTIIRSDGFSSYSKLKEVVTGHEVKIEPNKTKAAKLFPWANRTISNAKKVLLGIHHNAINDKYIQNYLDEFCYKFNRRYFNENLFDRLLNVAISTTWY
ncbi:MAG: IS1595 family transposase [Glaciecola sp.]